jgi:Domain of unknown function (DUF4160)
MPKIFEYLAYIIRFYSNDHLPVHVHVQVQDRESKAEFYFDENNGVVLLFKKVKGKEPLTEVETKEVAVFLKEYHLKIIEKWNKVFVFHQKVDCEIVHAKLEKKKL